MIGNLVGRLVVWGIVRINGAQLFILEDIYHRRWYWCNGKLFICLSSLSYCTDFKEGIRLGLYISPVSWAAGFTMGLSTSQRHGDEVRPPNSVAAPVLTTRGWQTARCEGASFYSRWPVLWGSHGGVAPPSCGVKAPTAMLALVHVCYSANPLVLASHWATSLWLSDFTVWREGFSRHCSNWFIPPPYQSPP